MVKPEDGDTGRRCAFCDATGVTREHVWAEWLQPLARHPVGRYRAGVVGGGLRDYLAPAFSHTVRRVCGQCNNGWMADLEGHTAPIIREMRQGTPMLLDEERQRTLSLWMHKTTLVVALTSNHEASRVSDSHYRELREKQDLPSGSQVWLATLDDDQVEAGSWVQRFEWQDLQEVGKPHREGHAFVVCVLGVVGFGLILGSAEHLQDVVSAVRLGPEMLRRFQRIWPPSASYVASWPPALSLTFDELTTVMDQLRRVGGTLEPEGLIPGPHPPS